MPQAAGWMELDCFVSFMFHIYQDWAVEVCRPRPQKATPRLPRDLYYYSVTTHSKSAHAGSTCSTRWHCKRCNYSWPTAETLAERIAWQFSTSRVEDLDALCTMKPSVLMCVCYCDKTWQPAVNRYESSLNENPSCLSNACSNIPNNVEEHQRAPWSFLDIIEVILVLRSKLSNDTLSHHFYPIPPHILVQAPPAARHGRLHNTYMSETVRPRAAWSLLARQWPSTSAMFLGTSVASPLTSWGISMPY